MRFKGNDCSRRHRFKAGHFRSRTLLFLRRNEVTGVNGCIVRGEAVSRQNLPNFLCSGTSPSPPPSTPKRPSVPKSIFLCSDVLCFSLAHFKLRQFALYQVSSSFIRKICAAYYILYSNVISGQ
ncbi:hypothetical protein CDAR_536201 [Caerostris darwini]|uniref:Uncharacterized protein n=1 Tax=Caerostris darwini TaxID=1538125 RepID=A0AAV4V7P1_9ARAC|nr:hypothetical protein CDAR_536201 [Caerostris darwini]